MNLLTQGKTNWKFVAIVVVLAVIVGGGILFWIKRTEIPSVEFPEIKKPEKIVEDETASWKTYRNEEYGYEIRYPSEWIIIKEDPKFVVFADEEETKIQKEKQAGEIRCSAGVWLYDNDEGLSLYDWVVNKWGEPEKRYLGKISKVEINNLEGIKYEFESMGLETNVLFSKNNKVIDIQTTFDGCTDLQTIFNQMLSTFRFIEVDETANWKTYRNENYKYEVKYPPDWKLYEPYPDSWAVSFTSPSLQKEFTIDILETSLGKVIGEKPPPVCLAGRCSDATFFKDAEITLNNIKGIQRQIIYGDFPGPLIQIETAFSKDKFVFTLGFRHWEISEIKSEDLDFYNQMLSTFRFLE